MYPEANSGIVSCIIQTSDKQGLRTDDHNSKDLAGLLTEASADMYRRLDALFAYDVALSYLRAIFVV